MLTNITITNMKDSCLLKAQTFKSNIWIFKSYYHKRGYAMYTVYIHTAKLIHFCFHTGSLHSISHKLRTQQLKLQYEVNMSIASAGKGTYGTMCITALTLQTWSTL